MKTITRTLLVALIVLAIATPALADFTGPFSDGYYILTPFQHVPGANNLFIQDDTTACTDSTLSYLQFDATNIGTVDTASLVFTVGTTSGIESSPTLSLYGAADFNPGTVTGGTAPVSAPGNLIQSIVIPSTAALGDKITFGGANTALETYIQSQADGDNMVTLILSYSANCNAVFSQINFFSQESATPANRPVLNITGTQPNAVTISNFSAEGGSAPNWLLYGGIAGVAVLALGAVMVLRRKAA